MCPVVSTNVTGGNTLISDRFRDNNKKNKLTAGTPLYLDVLHPVFS